MLRKIRLRWLLPNSVTPVSPRSRMLQYMDRFEAKSVRLSIDHIVHHHRLSYACSEVYGAIRACQNFRTIEPDMRVANCGTDGRGVALESSLPTTGAERIEA